MDKLDFNKNASRKSNQETNLRAHFDPVDYVQYLDGMDLTDKEAKEILMTLWNMMVQFVDLGFQIEFNSGEASQISMPSASTLDSEKNKARDMIDTEGNKL